VDGKARLIARNLGFVRIVKPGITYGTRKISDEECPKRAMVARVYDDRDGSFSRLRHASRVGAEIRRIRGERRGWN